ncbi:hypothetical protein CEXT_71971 [Caerostris extrusa]|uniref:Uncharacterized protein n=1 Tax=Caerostris extrusa TaxID=172846 RepID=A0AAV4QBT2_CAEEX|nr:hypothetical protein CEXT_71971 [Caerostris extrusa]
MTSVFFPSVIQMQFQSVHSKNIAQFVEMSNTESNHWPFQSRLLEHRNVTRRVFSELVSACVLPQEGRETPWEMFEEVPDISPFPPTGLPKTSQNILLGGC